NPQCGFCTAMANDLAALSTDSRNGRPVPLVVTTGEIGLNRQLVEQHGIRCTVLRQEQMEVAAQYHAAGTPMGYRIDADGRIASDLAVGAEALLRLAEPDTDDQSKSGKGEKSHGKEPDPSLSRSRLKRDGSRPAPWRPRSGCRGLTEENWPCLTCVAGGCCWCSPIPTAAPAMRWHRCCRKCMNRVRTCRWS